MKFCCLARRGNTSELYKDWNDTSKLYFEAIMEADMWVNLQVIPVQIRIITFYVNGLHHFQLKGGTTFVKNSKIIV